MKKKRKNNTRLLRELFRQSKGVIIGILLFSLCLNLLTLVVPLFLLQLYDRVIPNRSIDTLFVLTLIVIVALSVSSGLDVIRSTLLARAGAWLDARFSGQVLDGIIEKARLKGSSSVQGLHDMSTVRSFFSSSRLIPLLDAPWSPIFIFVLFMLHPLVGSLTLVAAIILIVLAIINEIVSRGPSKEANEISVNVMDGANAVVRNADAVSAMGMRANLINRWTETNSAALEIHTRSVARRRWLTASAKFVRLMLQVSVMFAAAWLIVHGQMSAGALIACVLLMRRAVSPWEGAISSWKSVISTRNALSRIDNHLTLIDKVKPVLQDPQGDLVLKNVRYYHEGAAKPILRQVTMTVSPGEAIAIVGTTGAGKSTLASLIVGNARPYRGHVYWGGNDVTDWDAQALGPHIGYLPQNAALFDGSVAENIARMGPFEVDDVISAAELAGVDDMIRSLPEGYDTQIGPEGMRLSGGQQQRVGLARAVYGRPKLFVLDEPDAHLDRKGRQALAGAIESLKGTDAIVILITHQVKLGGEIDRIVELRRGKVETITAPKKDRPAKRIT